jgi:mono/diheme cytochrome c family protein
MARLKQARPWPVHVGTACAGSLLLIGCGVLAGSQSPQRTPEKVYADTCGYCHGANVGPVIRGKGIPAAAVKLIVRSGMNTMPSFRPTEISPGELDAIAAWIEQSKADPKEKGK